MAVAVALGVAVAVAIAIGVLVDTINWFLSTYRNTMNHQNQTGTPMKPFNLTAALNGSPVQTRDGRNVKIVYNPDAVFHSCVLGWVFRNGRFDSYGVWTDQGTVYTDKTSHSADLFMKPTKREGWTNLHYTRLPDIADFVLSTGLVYDTEAEAKSLTPNGYVATVKIEWDE